MPVPRRKLQATAEETLNPPAVLPPTQQIARIVKAEGKNLYSVELPSGEQLLLELQSRFRSSIWLRRGGFVVLDLDRTLLGKRENKIGGEIVNVVREEKRWRKMAYWPTEFAKKSFLLQDPDDENDSLSGRLPGSDEEVLISYDTGDKVDT